ncbi:MAG: ABC transporter ATP-binding protein [Flavobacteriales bacterium]
MVHVEGVTHSFSGKQVLKSLSFEIKKGEFYSLLGPNGAGKTTTINILSALLSPDAGNVTVNGFSLRKNAVNIRRSIGVVPQEIALYEELTGLENLLFWGSLYNVPKSTIRQRALELLEAFGLSDRKNDKLAVYSGGMKRRINIASALLHDPEIIYMDEPTVGIDPQSRNNIYEFILRLQSQGKTILYTTHYMEEAERFSNRIGIIDNGTMLAQGTLNELLTHAKQEETLTITCENVGDEIKQKLSQTLASYQPLWEENIFHAKATKFKDEFKNVLGSFIDASVEIKNIEKQHTNLESLFLQLTGKTLRD